MLHSSVGRHIPNKTNYLVDIYSPAEVCDNGAPCLQRQTHAFSPQRAAKRPSPASVAEECAPIPCRFPSLPAYPGKPSPWEYPGINPWWGPSFLCCFWVNFNDSSCIHAHLWLAFLFIYFFPLNVLMCQAASSLLDNVQCLGNRWALFFHQVACKNEILSIKLQSVTFYLEWLF